MKNSTIIPLSLLLLMIGLMACNMDDTQTATPVSMENKDTNSDTTGNRRLGGPIRIKVGSSTFGATLLDNPTVTAFKARLPMTISMVELNGNEKYHNVPKDPLPTNASNPGTIQSGDLMLYGSNTLVIFYKSFSTPYSYTKLGRIDNPAGLAAALGSGNVTVTFELK
ncbi:cyclophilin-like fold protein [Fibrella aquatica]|uniref:cyclophilin-like fold protein n=1 Tax=Fibrella aquatica TaxID=3242487 RepID=UPI003520660C